MATETSIAGAAIQSVLKGKKAFCRFLAAIDTGRASTHQSGIYMPKSAGPLLFDHPAVRGENETRTVKMVWQGDKALDNNIKYYGKAKNEYRITSFGRGFELLRPENTGALLVMSQLEYEDYEAWVLESEDDIEAFLDYFGMSPTETNSMIDVGYHREKLEEREAEEIAVHVRKFSGFPSTIEMALAARQIYDTVYDNEQEIVKNPDKRLLNWSNMEYTLFKAIEEVVYRDTVGKGFDNVQDFLAMANSVLNRRKARAGKSLEYHLEAILTGNALRFDKQSVTEINKVPDFIFPGKSYYHDLSFPADKLIVLAAKTTCKDRWRQVITEADRVETKYLCTLQQSNSINQLEEMRQEHVVLVVPKEYIQSYPAAYRQYIMSIQQFIAMVKEKLADI